MKKTKNKKVKKAITIPIIVPISDCVFIGIGHQQPIMIIHHFYLSDKNSPANSESIAISL